MAQDGRRLPILLVGLLWTANLTSCFNLEPRLKHLYNFTGTQTQGRKPYFGFSVALQNSRDNTNWLMVGAPRANSSYHRETEPGAVFKCALTSDTCEELEVNLIADSRQATALNDHGWLGGSLDTQPDYRSDRQATCVCASKWRYEKYGDIRMPGACSLALDSISTGTFSEDSKIPFEDRIDSLAGFSVHFPASDSTKLLLGAPAVSNRETPDYFTGSIVVYEDKGKGSGGRKKRATSHRDMFSTPKVMRIRRDRNEEGGLLGYSVTSGHFLHPNKTQYAAGAPQDGDSHGKVIIFEFPTDHDRYLLVKNELSGLEMGEYFGAAVTAADINGDGLDDLVVGSPMYSSRDPIMPEIGRIHTFISVKLTGPRNKPVSQHYGMNVSFARFGISLTSLGDLNVDNYHDIAVGAPWEDKGAVYIFLGSPSGLKHQYSQRLSPKDFAPYLMGFGMSVSRGTDVDNNGYPDLAIGNFLSGHALVVKSRPVAVLSGTVTSTPSSVKWEEEATVTLETCLTYTGHMVPQNLNVQAKLILDQGSIAPRAFFTDNTNTLVYDDNLQFEKTNCQTHQATVKEHKLDPDRHITMQLEYKLVEDPNVELKKRPVTDPAGSNSNTTDVSILKECKDKICRVDMTTQADLIGGNNNFLVIGKVNELRVNVSNSGEPVYVPAMNVTAGPHVALSPESGVLPSCLYDADDKKASMKCILNESIKKPTQGSSVDTTEKEKKGIVVNVEVNETSLMPTTSHVNLQVNVSGEGDVLELQPDDNVFSMTLQLAAEANLELHGSSEREQFPYEFTEDDQIIITDNARFNHTFILIKRGATSLTSINLTLEIPVRFTGDIVDFVKVHSFTPKKKKDSFTCALYDNNGLIAYTAGVTVPTDTNDVHSSSGSETVSAKKGEDIGTQYFNCSSSLVRCAQLRCQIQDWTVISESAEISVELEVDLRMLAKHISVQGGAVFGTLANATVDSLNPLWAFIGESTTTGEALTYILPATLPDEIIPWWVILLAVLGGLLLLGLLAYGLHKKGFFKREKLAELKAHRANLESSPRGALAGTGN